VEVTAWVEVVDFVEVVPLAAVVPGVADVVPEVVVPDDAVAVVLLAAVAAASVVPLVAALWVAEATDVAAWFPAAITPTSEAKDARLMAVTATLVFMPCRRRARRRSSGGVAAVPRRACSRRMRSACSSGVISLIGLLRSLLAARGIRGTRARSRVPIVAAPPKSDARGG
jgi:hypothetical protein